MNKPGFREVFSRIKAYQNELFHTKTGLEFSYSIDGNGFYPSRTTYRISISDIKKAYELVPFEGPGVVNAIVRGPAYLWAVLHDPRIRENNW